MDICIALKMRCFYSARQDAHVTGAPKFCLYIEDLRWHDHGNPIHPKTETEQVCTGAIEKNRLSKNACSIGGMTGCVGIRSGKLT